jgi:hypothetical protein
MQHKTERINRQTLTRAIIHLYPKSSRICFTLLYIYFQLQITETSNLLHDEIETLDYYTFSFRFSNTMNKNYGIFI